jgi:hypothetical protein
MFGAASYIVDQYKITVFVKGKRVVQCREVFSTEEYSLLAKMGGTCLWQARLDGWVSELKLQVEVVCRRFCRRFFFVV